MSMELKEIIFQIEKWLWKSKDIVFLCKMTKNYDFLTKLAKSFTKKMFWLTYNCRVEFSQIKSALLGTLQPHPLLPLLQDHMESFHHCLLLFDWLQGQPKSWWLQFSPKKQLYEEQSWNQIHFFSYTFCDYFQSY